MTGSGGTSTPGGILTGREFVKMSGGGNDFVVFDDREAWFPEKEHRELVPRLCRRGLGVGADAVLLLQRSAEADVRMAYYNADGGEAPMCGNGAMCIARYARLVGAVDGEELALETGSGVFRARVPDTGRPDVTLWLVPPKDLTLRCTDLEEGPYRRVGFLDAATPHVVALLGSLDAVEAHDVRGEGRRLRAHPNWDPPGTNANFVAVVDRSTLRMRTYERGVEDETLSCGTGATASAILTHLWGLTDPPVSVRTTGGLPLRVDFTPGGSGAGPPIDPSLAGQALIVYRGTIAQV
ncbi:MAG: diaminopimelate epimerase [Gemmatimonadetes bacterium]|nr:diaminopimelate epimerase [Gemmatimonadota bacterium]